MTLDDLPILQIPPGPTDVELAAQREADYQRDLETDRRCHPRLCRCCR